MRCRQLSNWSQAMQPGNGENRQDSILATESTPCEHLAELVLHSVSQNVCFLLFVPDCVSVKLAYFKILQAIALRGGVFRKQLDYEGFPPMSKMYTSVIVSPMNLLVPYWMCSGAGFLLVHVPYASTCVNFHITLTAIKLES